MNPSSFATRPQGNRRRLAGLAALVTLPALALGVGCSTDAEPMANPGAAWPGGCPPGQTLCGASCVSLDSNTAHCGSCDNICPSGTTCVDGTCTCQAGLTACATGCTNTNEDGDNCGACGTVCVAPQVCSMGICTDTCAEGLTACGTSCVDTNTSIQHCGGCNVACPAGQVCSAGTCQCEVAGQLFCGGACVDVQSNAAHCGACDNVCAAGESCTNGVCTDASTAGTGGAGGDTGGTGGDSDCPGGEIFPPPSPESFTETVNGVSFDLVYVPGGTFTIGCETGSCPADTTPVSGVTVSSYLIGKAEVTTDLYDAVMGGSSGGFGGPSITWYDAMEFACQLSQMTGKNYRMTTEAEWEYAAKNHLSSLDDIGSGEEWAYNSWSGTHMGGTDPVGPGSGAHTQKTRRDAQGTADNITGRLIRSIDGIGPALRLAISAEMEFPPDYVPPCDLCAPVMGDEPENSYRDPRWVTGSDAHWTTGETAIGNFDLRVWEDGTANLNGTDGQWFTSNNIAFVFVPSSGSSTKYAYIFLDDTQGSLISDESFMSGGYIGRIVKEPADNYAKPTISGLQSGADLAAAAGNDYDMVDMVNIPESAKEQDPRLIDGPDQCWFQDNTNVGGLHHYRKDVDPEEFRFTVNQGSQTMLANGSWFTVNNTFLRITHSGGYTCDYLYAVTSDGTFYHNSFQGYERADFRMFQIKSNSESFPATCGSHCSSEIPMGQDASFYATQDVGQSTFVPAPCPAGGCY